ncbi:DUF6505 family protein [Alsobacter sp. R-9]
MKLPRTIRLDPSDRFVFERAAEPGEWAVSGAFLHADVDPDSLDGKQRTALRSGFLGVSSFGFSTLVVVTEASAADREEAIARLAGHFVTRLGAPDLGTARAAAAEEVDFAASLCDHPVNTILAVHRSVEADGLVERFRTFHERPALPGTDRLHAHARAFTIEEFDDEGPAETVDLTSLAGKGGAPR